MGKQFTFFNTLQGHAIPSDLHFVGPSFVFQQDMTLNISLGYVRAICYRKRVMECSIR